MAADQGEKPYWQRLNDEQSARNVDVRRRIPFILLGSLMLQCLTRAGLGAVAAITNRGNLLGVSPRGGLVWLALAAIPFLMMLTLGRLRRWRARRSTLIAAEHPSTPE